MRPDVGTQAQFRKKLPPKTYRYDDSLSPSLEWDGQNPARERGEAFSLLEAVEASDPTEVEESIHDAVVQMFKDAKVRFERKNARGDTYSLADDSYEEFIHWFDMPWE